MFWTKGSKKPLSLRVHATWPCMPYIRFPVFFISSLSMIIKLFAIRKDVPLYVHFTSIKTEQQYRTPLSQLLPSGEYFSTKILQGINFNIHTKLLNLVSLLVNYCKLIFIWISTWWSSMFKWISNKLSMILGGWRLSQARLTKARILLHMSSNLCQRQKTCYALSTYKSISQDPVACKPTLTLVTVLFLF